MGVHFQGCRGSVRWKHERRKAQAQLRLKVERARNILARPAVRENILAEEWVPGQDCQSTMWVSDCEGSFESWVDRMIENATT